MCSIHVWVLSSSPPRSALHCHLLHCYFYSPTIALEGLMLKLELQYFGLLMQRVDSLEKTLMLGKTEGKKRRGQRKLSWLDSITDSMDMNVSKLQEIVKDMKAWCAAVHGVTKSWTQLSNSTTTINVCEYCLCHHHHHHVTTITSPSFSSSLLLSFSTFFMYITFLPQCMSLTLSSEP